MSHGREKSQTRRFSPCGAATRAWPARHGSGPVGDGALFFVGWGLMVSPSCSLTRDGGSFPDRQDGTIFARVFEKADFSLSDKTFKASSDNPHRSSRPLRPVLRPGGSRPFPNGSCPWDAPFGLPAPPSTGRLTILVMAAGSVRVSRESSASEALPRLAKNRSSEACLAPRSQGPQGVGEMVAQGPAAAAEFLQQLQVGLDCRVSNSWIYP